MPLRDTDQNIDSKRYFGENSQNQMAEKRESSNFGKIKNIDSFVDI